MTCFVVVAGVFVGAVIDGFVVVLVPAKVRLCIVPGLVPRIARGVRSRRCTRKWYSLLDGEDDRMRKRRGNPGWSFGLVVGFGVVFESARGNRNARLVELGLGACNYLIRTPRNRLHRPSRIRIGSDLEKTRAEFLVVY